MTISIFRFHKTYREANGWSPDWVRYCHWLKERKHKALKRRLKEEALEERRKHNDKVLRQYGLGKYQRKGDW